MDCSGLYQEEEKHLLTTIMTRTWPSYLHIQPVESNAFLYSTIKFNFVNVMFNHYCKYMSANLGPLK